MHMRKRIFCIALAFIMFLGVLPELRLNVSAAEMDLSDKGLAAIKQYEGYTNNGKPYWDYAQYSIGYGSYCCGLDLTNPANKEKYDYYMANPLTEPQAAELLRQELQGHIGYVRTFLKNHPNVTLKQHQFDALVSFTYNCGPSWVWEHEGNLHKAVESGNLGTELVYGMLLWGSAGGDFILISRRMNEANMYINGDYVRDGYSKENFRYVFLDGAGGTTRYKIHGYYAKDGSAVKYNFTQIPSYTDSNGVEQNYIFDGWYTARSGGTKVTKLDGSLADGTVLYAHWKTADGKSTVIPESQTGVNIKVKVAYVNEFLSLRSGPGTYYAKIGELKKNEEVTITQTATSRSTLWGKCSKGWIQLTTYTDYSEKLASALPRWATVTADGVNVRKSAGTSAAVVGTKKNGDQVQVTEWTHADNLMWGKIGTNQWICLQYVEWNSDVYNGEVTAVEIEKLPTKLTYVQKAEGINLAGGKLTVTYADSMALSVPMNTATVSGFDNSTVGKKTVTLTLAGKQVTFDVEIIKATVTFKDYDGKVISSAQYAHGDKVAVPANPTRPNDGHLTYIFRGWSSAVSATCTGSATYTAVYDLLGDVGNDGKLNDQDAIYLLRHTLFPELYPVNAYADFNADGKVNDQDAVYLLRHTLFPDLYPLKTV